MTKEKRMQSATICGRGPTTDYDSVIIRYYWDAMYIRKAGIWLDVKIITKTAAQGISNLVIAFFGLFKKKKSGIVVES